MNCVTTGFKPKRNIYSAEDLKNNNQTAFIGKCGFGPEHELYLITYDGIVLATDPQRAWSYGGCSVVVEQFVDIEITIK